MHRITGPYQGYFVAAYTAYTKGGHVGYGRAYAQRPADDWRGPTGADLYSGAYANELQALVAAEHKVRLEIETLPANWDPFTSPGELGEH